MTATWQTSFTHGPQAQQNDRQYRSARFYNDAETAMKNATVACGPQVKEGRTIKSNKVVPTLGDFILYLRHVKDYKQHLPRAEVCLVLPRCSKAVAAEMKTRPVDFSNKILIGRSHHGFCIDF